MHPTTRSRTPVDDAARTILSSIDSFAAAGGRPLRTYQSDCARAIVRSVLGKHGRTFTVMFARQMGKNETSAQIEAYLMAIFAARSGTIIKAAPSFKPQLVNSMLRLRGILEQNPATRERWRPTYGYIYELGRASTMFLSADPKASVVGATASLLLELDEAQDINEEKYTRDFRPMASSQNATTVLYGTAWSDDSVLQRQKETNLTQQLDTGEQLHFEFDWTALARINPYYQAFVQAEIDRLGADHPNIQTQYLLHCLHSAGRLLSSDQLATLQSNHPRLLAPIDGEIYIAGIDIAGQDEEAEDAAIRAQKPRLDSTVVTIARLTRTDEGTPVAQVVHHLWWTGRDHANQLSTILELWDTWRFAAVTVDASGIGYGLAHDIARSQPDRTELFTFSAPKKSALAYEMLAMINTHRLTLYQSDQAPDANECWWQLEHTRYKLRPGEILQWYVPPAEGHDDFTISLALCAHAAQNAAPPALGGIQRAPRPEDDSTW